MDYKIIMDSSGDMRTFGDTPFAGVPLKILAGDREFVDDCDETTQEMVDYLREYKGKTSTACPSVDEFVEAFGEAENVFCVTITSGLSGCYNAACIAADTYEEEHPGRRAHVFDSLATGPEMVMIAEKVDELVAKGLSFDEVVAEVKEYQKKTHLIFALASLRNLANNGRVSPAVAVVAGVLGIRLIAKASDIGTIEQLGKARGEKKAIAELMRYMGEMGFKGGKVRISHCRNEAGAKSLAAAIMEKFPSVDVKINPTSALCSYYAEEGGMLLGFEG